MIINVRKFLPDGVNNVAEMLWVLYLDNQIQRLGHTLSIEDEKFDFKYTGSRQIWVELARRTREGIIQGNVPLPYEDEEYSTQQGKYMFAPQENEPRLSEYFPIKDGVLTWDPSRVKSTTDGRLHHILLSSLAEHCVEYVVNGVSLPKMTGLIDTEDLNFTNELYYVFQRTLWGREHCSFSYHRLLLSGDRPISTKEIDFNLWFYELLYKGRLQALDYNQKYKILQDDFHEGGIYVLWTRDRVSKSNPIGVIKHASLIRLDKITPRGINYSLLPVQMNYEDLVTRFLSQTQKSQFYFQDMLKVEPREIKESIGFSNLSVGDYISEEMVILRKLETVTGEHLIWDGTKFNKVEMSDPELALYALNQLGYSIDSELLVQEYNLDKSWLGFIKGTDFKAMMSDLYRNVMLALEQNTLGMNEELLNPSDDYLEIVSNEENNDVDYLDDWGVSQ